MVCTMTWRPRDANTVVFCSDLRVEACTHHCFHSDFEHSGLLILGPKASRPIFSNLGPLSILTEILHILFMTFANSLAQGLPAYFAQSGVPPNPYWNITHSLYDICQFLGPMPPRPFSSIWAPSKSLLKYYTFSVWHLLILGPRASQPILHTSTHSP